MAAAPAPRAEPFEVAAGALPAVRGLLHRPARPTGTALVLTHGASGSARAPLLTDVAVALAAEGVTVLCCDLPYRQRRAAGPPSPATSGRDRDGLRHAVLALRAVCPGPVFLGGHSYGGRQASLLAAADPDVAAGLLLLSYPLHRPARPEELRTGHFPDLRVPALFVHGARDPFGAPEALDRARALIPARTELLVLPGGHDLGYGRSAGGEAAIAPRIARAFLAFIAREPARGS